jgi:hypothetical protein
MSDRELVEGELLPSNGHAEAFASGHAIQQVRTPYATAVVVQKPRSLGAVLRSLKEEARLAGEDFYYGWAAGKDRVEGPSVSLALAAARCWGNCAVEPLPVQDLGDSWVFTAAFVDLETGFTLSRQFRQSKKSAVAGKLDGERKDDIRFQVGQSKAIRNVILNSLPPSLVKAALEEAKRGVRLHIEELVGKKGLAGAVDLALKALGKCGVREDAVLAKCGVADPKGLTVDHLVMLKGDLTAIEGGQERPEVLFPPAEQQEAPSTSAPVPPAKKGGARKKTIALILEMAADLGLTPVEREELCAHHGLKSLEDATEHQAQEVIATLTDALEKRKEEAAEREAIQQEGAG